ncbi:glycosyltransferase [Lutimonas saemankumensis]|uniref:glycosyltransferase n=1 Tax=Lutimonas saemankumensis TaxID=483016 RepID=UPI001CD7628F|nr:glycosyltransferase [Lutimonas saemankumensis]MCA0930927.1 glycosyltransferase [Lutimonas saemankumensis]
MKKVSVIMSVFNCEKFLTTAIESILQQSFADFEFIIFDDASTDGSGKIIKSYAEADDRVIAIFNTENQGLTKNLNKGIAMSKAVYIARMDADDIALPNRLSRQVEYLDKNTHIDIVGSSAIDIDENGNQLQKRQAPESHQEIIKLLPKANPMIHSTVVFRRKSLEKIEFYNESYRTTQDYEMWFRAAGNGMIFCNLSEILLLYRMDNNYHRRKSIRYRLYDCKLRLESFKYLGIPKYKYYYALIPIILGLLPEKVYDSVKKLDPRVKSIG